MVHLKYSFNKINDQISDLEQKLKFTPSTNRSLVLSKCLLEKAQCYQEDLVCVRVKTLEIGKYFPKIPFIVATLESL